VTVDGGQATARVGSAAAGLVDMQDLEALHRPLRGQLEAAAQRVLASGRYILGGPGSEVEAFEREAKEALGAAHAIGLSSGTDALLALLMACGVGPGDEVVTTPFSFIATADGIARLGARPVFVDIEPETWTLDPLAAIESFGPRTKAVLPVHLFGRLSRLDPLQPVCARDGIALLEDAAQSIGAGPGGGVGRGTALSFFPTKNLGGFGDGGMVLTNDDAVAARVRTLRTHGAAGRFHHTVLGGNFRLDELQGALLRVKLPHLGRWTTARRTTADWYRQGLAGLPIGLPPADATCVWNQFVVTVGGGQRDALAAFLRLQGIATAVYYPEPLPAQPCFRDLGYTAGALPVTERACREILALPMHADLNGAQVERVVAAIKSFFTSGLSRGS